MSIESEDDLVARSAPQIFYGCPTMTLISVNDEVVHGLPGLRRLRANVPNFFDPRQHDVLTEGLVLTIEPLIAEHPCRVVMEPDGWTLRTDNGALAAHFEETVVITRGTPFLLTSLS